MLLNDFVRENSIYDKLKKMFVYEKAEWKKSAKDFPRISCAQKFPENMPCISISVDMKA